MSQRTVKLKSAPFHTLKAVPSNIKSDKTAEHKPEKVQSLSAIRLVSKTTRINEHSWKAR